MKFNFSKFSKSIGFTNSVQKFKTFRVIDVHGNPMSDLH